MKICTKCNEKWPDEFAYCPICRGELVIDKPKASPSVSMGDGNAINGGVHISEDKSVKDDHSVSASNNVTNSNNTTHNTTNNYYSGLKFEREKTTEELLREQKLKFREYCKEVLAKDKILNDETNLWLDEQRRYLGLKSEEAAHILNEVKKSIQRSFISMDPLQEKKFNAMKNAIKGNNTTMIENLMPSMKVLASNIHDEELQYMYHMVLAALYPEECVNQYKTNLNDKYWRTFWGCVALYKLGDIENAEAAMLKLKDWNGMMSKEEFDDNQSVLATLGALIYGDKEFAKPFFEDIKNVHTSLLTNIAKVIKAIINYNPEDSDIKVILTQNKFYVDNFLSKTLEAETTAARLAAEEKQRKELELKRKQEEERKRKEEEERRKAEEEERKRKEEEARRKAEEEARKKKEEEIRRKAEEEERKRKELEARLKAEEETRKKKEEEIRRKAEEEAKKKLEEERKKLEETKKRIEEERKALEAEQKRKAQEEAEKKRRQEEEQRRIEMEKQAKKDCQALVNQYLLNETPFLDIKSADIAKTIKGLSYLRTPEILFMYAVCTEQGYYGRTNKETLTQLYLEAAEAGEPLGYVCLANLYSSGEHGFIINSKTAMSYYEKCLTTNRRMQALTHMGIAYSRAYQDLPTAKKYLEEAIKLGSNVAGKYLKDVQKKIDDQNIQLERERKAREADQKRKEREEEERRRKIAETIAATAASNVISGSGDGDVKVCPQCKNIIAANATFCKYCGHRFEDYKSNLKDDSKNKKEETNKQQTRVCPQCKKTILADATFCKYCGRKMVPTTATSKSCPKCGRQLNPNAKFCPKCGTKV